jgi:hypothetical protein
VADLCPYWMVLDFAFFWWCRGRRFKSSCPDQSNLVSFLITLLELNYVLEVARDHRRKNKIGPLREVVADKGYHSNDTLRTLHEEQGLITSISEPNRGRRKWKGKQAERKVVYRNRKRIRSEMGIEYRKRRSELVERTFAHCYETGAMRRTHLRGHENILKRLLIHVGAFNLSLMLRKTSGAGTPRGLWDAKGTRTKAGNGVTRSIMERLLSKNPVISFMPIFSFPKFNNSSKAHRFNLGGIMTFATGC